MFVGNRMKKDVITVAPGDTLRRAGSLLKEHRIHHLPVLKGTELVGIVTDTDIRNARLAEAPPGAAGPPAAEDRTVGEVMTRDVVTLSPRDTIEDAALILHRRRFEAIPVVEGCRLVGIVAKADVIGAFLDTLNIEAVGVRVEVVLPQETAAVLRLVRVFGEMPLSIRSLILSPRGKEFVAFVRVSTIDVASVRERLREEGFKVPGVADFLK
ncbi:MAG: CBS domain-containing protein [Deltaproteobacteria bacterium]|nr:CBS domain-containing protein [Deltaproteobacteria bacterium]